MTIYPYSPVSSLIYTHTTALISPYLAYLRIPCARYCRDLAILHRKAPLHIICAHIPARLALRRLRCCGSSCWQGRGGKGGGLGYPLHPFVVLRNDWRKAVVGQPNPGWRCRQRPSPSPQRAWRMRWRRRLHRRRSWRRRWWHSFFSEERVGACAREE